MFQPTIALDFDGVIHEYKSKWTVPEEVNDGPTPGALEAIHEYLNAGIKVVIYTTRVSTHGKDNPKFQCNPAAALVAVRAWLEKHGFPLLEVISEKPAAVMYVDDRAYLFTGENWPTVQEVKNFVPWNKRDQPWAQKKRMKGMAKKFARIRELKDALQDAAEGICDLDNGEAMELVKLLEEVVL
jgi:hypothetical protein